MSLYSRSRTSLHRRAPSPAFGVWVTLARNLGVVGAHGHGAQIVENCQREAHFGEPPPRPAGIRSFDAFLEAVVVAGGTAQEQYQKACDQHPLQGTPVPAPALPPTAWRYVTLSALRRSLLTVDPKLAPHLKNEAAFALDVRRNWSTFWSRYFARALLDQPGRAVFAAVPANGSPAQLSGGVAVSTIDALGLPQHPTSRFELRYATSDLLDVRVPTVADAGWFAFFRPSAPGAILGSTFPRTGVGNGFDEVVHAARDMSMLQGAPRWLR